MIYNAFSFIQVDDEAINQKGNNLLSEAHGLKQPPQGPPPSQDSTQSSWIGCPFLWNNPILLDGRHGCWFKR